MINFNKVYENVYENVYDIRRGGNLMPYIPPFELTEKMFSLVEEISENLGSLKHVNDLEKFPRLRRASRIRSIHSSLAIENNSLSIEDVTDVIDGKRVIGDKDDILAVKNAKEAYKLIPQYNPCEIKDLLKAHFVMMNGLVDGAGNFRHGAVGVFDSNGRPIHIAPSADIVPENMLNLFEWLKNSKTNQLIKSCVFHYEFEFIHPFNDGNGRTGRLWQTVILTNWKPIFQWIPIESIIKDNQEKYYLSISDSTKKGSSTPFIEFMLGCINEAVKDIANNTRNHYNHISKQITALLNVMETYPLSSNEIMERLNLKSRNSFLEHYIKPALAAGLIVMTIPDKPKSKNQMYIKL